MTQNTQPHKVPITANNHPPPSIDLLKLGDPELVPCCAMERAQLMKAIRDGRSPEDIVAQWSDTIPGTSDSIRRAVISFNDRCGSTKVGDARRARVFTPDLLELLANTTNGLAVEERRRWAFANWSFRVSLPEILSLTPTFAGWAEQLRALPPIENESGRMAGRRILNDLWDEAYRVRRAVYARLRAKYAEAAAEAARSVRTLRW
jgi:hypothetical protein